MILWCSIKGFSFSWAKKEEKTLQAAPEASAIELFNSMLPYIIILLHIVFFIA